MTSLLRRVLGDRTAPRGISRQRRVRPLLEGLEERLVMSTLIVDTNPAKGYTTVQAAVNVAKSGDTISIDSGTYSQHVVVPANGADGKPFTSLTIKPTSTTPTIKAESGWNGAIIDIQGARGVTIQNLLIDGSGVSSMAQQGIFIEQGGAATISGNTIQNINDTRVSGREGIAVRVGRSALAGTPTTGSATISGNRLIHNGAEGVDISNGSTATVTGNTITGDGNTGNRYVQYGVEMSDGSTGTVSSNSISNYGFKVGIYESAGVLLYNPGAGATVSGNSIASSHVGVWVLGGTDVKITGNSVTGAALYGIATDSPDGGTTTVQGATITGNSASSTLAGAEGFDLYYLTGTNGHTVTISGNSASNNTAYGFNIGNLTSTYTSGGTSNLFNFSGNSASNDGSNPTGDWVLATDGTGIPGATGTDGIFISSATLSATGAGTIMTPFLLNGNTASANAGYGVNIQNITATLSLTGNATVSGPISIMGNTAASNKAGGFNLQNITLSARGTGTATNTAEIENNTAGGSSSSAGNTGNGYTFNNVTVTASGSITFTGEAEVEKNNAQYNTRAGFAILNSPGVVIDGGGTSFSNNNGGAGFLVQNSNGAGVTNYLAQLNTGNGFDLQSSANLNIAGDTAGGSSSTGNKASGFSFTGVRNSTVKGNQAQYNALNGIVLDAASTGNTISGNTFTSNDTAHSSIAYDANDQSTGTGTGGSANTWSGNTLGTKNKSGLR